MGQIITFFQEVPHIIEEVMNIVLITLSLLAILKGVYNVMTCGLIGLISFLLLCGKSCSLIYKDTYNFSSIELDLSHLNMTLPMSCSRNNSHHYVFFNGSGLEMTFTNDSLLNHKFCNLSDAHKKNLYDHALMGIVTTFHLSIPNFNQYEAMACDFNGGNISIQYNLSHNDRTDAMNHCGTVANGVLDAFYRFHWGRNITYIAQLPNGDGTGRWTFCYATSYKYLVIQNISWADHCQMSRPTPIGFASILSQRIRSIYISRRLMSTFTWSLSDSSGTENPGGYCLTRWMLFAADLKCFGNTAIAKCNLNHDEEFCDMLRLIDFNKQALKTFKSEVNHGLQLITKAINALINDQLIMKNHLRDLMGIPYCNYSKFWYLNDTRTGRVSLPKCWMISNGTYLNETHFSDEIEQEADNMITEMLRKEYQERQGKTPLGLVDLFIFSTSFYSITVFLHLIKIPTHRHIVGQGCPKPHRLNSRAICSCGAYKQPGLPTKWKR
ncbi:glycoprotein precursor [Mammarenavirus ippyense]|uniref:Pre-glycoprotein polyprotein GP complex n=1 Tax=Ippy mammarenavirus (isolate Rat/Central African Republic/Dak An B 188 d/1970) TaxID=3052308 RepID=GLYC_IPPYV|nr:glycoprotein precursor [Mammarenavirus ippyense]Q27YE4.1 RecName: Full=Pre-glycoprotein polyprotein GP complex; Short=Pre-GP-C; Contains: RecName: Full=Stable signal peptide; Short=SSP; Contains: RecName: Full=Glycoprotein G1; Short=GP1; Contains: RecName: Full=Glycoprotein G2; Short=GP2 [Mammarenavirus ippyense]ABC71140.1 glycoprotein precursor [Mammarenavirus ippyense]